MVVLVGCEESQAVCIAFRKAGHEAYSCDLLPCSGGHPEWHLQMDVFNAISGGYLTTQSGETIYIKDWAMAIFFPTCTFLTLTANKWYEDQPPLKSGALVGKERRDAREQALQFVCDLMNAEIPRIAIENPLGVIGTRIYWNRNKWAVSSPGLKVKGRKPDQIIQPHYFGDEARKTTCLWLKGLPKLVHNKSVNLFDSVVTHVSEGESIEWIDSKTGKKKRQPKWYADAKQDSSNLQIRSTERSKTFQGIAKAMSLQWNF